MPVLKEEGRRYASETMMCRLAVMAVAGQLGHTTEDTG